MSGVSQHLSLLIDGTLTCTGGITGTGTLTNTGNAITTGIIYGGTFPTTGGAGNIAIDGVGGTITFDFPTGSGHVVLETTANQPAQNNVITIPNIPVANSHYMAVNSFLDTGATAGGNIDDQYTGGVILVHAAVANITWNLLAPINSGVQLRFILATHSTGAVILSAGAHTITGMLMNTNTGATNAILPVPVAAQAAIRFLPAALVGDYIDLVADGNGNWYCSGWSGAIGFATP